MGRRKKIPTPEILADAVSVPSVSSVEESVFEDFDDYSKPEGPVSPVIVRGDGIPPLDSDLTSDQKREFLNLIRKEMPIAERAHQLAILARFTDTKRAPVALRAIIEMNLLDGMKEERPTEETPMFVLPESAKVAVLVQSVKK